MRRTALFVAIVLAFSAQTPAPSLRHLVYQFGYNTKAAPSGQGTGTTTIDITGTAPDGGMMVTAADFWWNTVRPRQSNTCEVYPDGGVTCSEPPYALSPIQVAIVPLLGRNYFSHLSSGLNASWTQSYKIRATFMPAATTGFAGQVYTWNASYTLNAQGTVPNAAPLVLIRSSGAMKQQGGQNITANSKANIIVDPRVKTPVLVYEEFTFVPRLTTNTYTVDLQLIRD